MRQYIPELTMFLCINLIPSLLLTGLVQVESSISFRFELALVVAILLLAANLFRARQIADLKSLYYGVAA